MGIALGSCQTRHCFGWRMASHLGELCQDVADAGAAEGITIELDTSDRTRPGEERSGASPPEVLTLVIQEGGKLLTEGFVTGVGMRMGAIAVDWFLTHLVDSSREPSYVSVLDKNGKVIRRVEIPKDGTEPRDEPGTSAR